MSLNHSGMPTPCVKNVHLMRTNICIITQTASLIQNSFECYNLGMNSKPEYSFKVLLPAIIISLMSGALITHAFDANHYTEQTNEVRQNALVDYQNLESDTSEYISQIKGKLDCSNLKVPQNIQHCKLLNSVN